MNISRRGILLGSLSTAISSNAHAIFHRAVVTAPPPPFVFQGNPNVTTSAVDVVTNGIVAQRTSGNTPCFIQVSASGILCMATNSNGNTVLPYEDLMYVWTDGQGSAADTVVDPTNNLGTVVSTGTQYGPEAVFCYRVAGTYTVTLTVYYQTAPGVYAHVSATTTITVTAWAGTTFYLDTGAGIPNGCDGTSPTFVSGTTGPFNASTAIATINAAIKNAGNNRRLLVAQGSTYHIPTGTSLAIGGNGNTGGRIDSYVGSFGAAAKPIFIPDGAPQPGQIAAIIFAPTNGASPAGDNVISNIEVFITGTSTAGQGIGADNNAFSAANPWNNNYIDTCDVLDPVLVYTFSNVGFQGFAGSNSMPTAGWGLWKCNLISQLSDGTHGLYSEVWNWFFVLGCTFMGAAHNATFDHHIYPETNSHSCYRWNTFGETGGTSATQRSYGINVNSQAQGPVATSVGGSVVSQYHYVGDNCFGAMTLTTGGQIQFAHDMSTANNEPAWALYNNVVTERNFVVSLQGNGSNAGAFLYFNQNTHTIRNNKFYDCQGIFTANTACLDATHTQGYGNKIYKPNSGTGVTMPNYFSEGSTASVTVSLASPAVLTMARTAANPVGFPINITLSTAAGLSNGVYYVASTIFNGTNWNFNISASPTLTPLVNTTGSGTCTVQTLQSLMQPQTWTDNIIWDDRTVPSMWTLHAFSEWRSSGNKSLIDRNQYYTPNAASPTPFNDASVGNQSFATWQGSPNLFDVNGSFSTSSHPSWSDPAHGIFS